MKKQEYKQHETQLKSNGTYEGISLEEKLRIATTTKEPLEAISHEIYTERKDGVLPQYDPRTDRFDIALEQQSKAEKIRAAQREEAPKAEEKQVEQTPKTE